MIFPRFTSVVSIMWHISYISSIYTYCILFQYAHIYLMEKYHVW